MDRSQICGCWDEVGWEGGKILTTKGHKRTFCSGKDSVGLDFDGDRMTISIVLRTVLL